MNKFIKIGQAAQLLGVSVQTLRRWEDSGQLLPEPRVDGGTRYFDAEKLLKLKAVESELTIAYARTSAKEESNAFKLQIQQLESFCMQNGWNYKILRDRGSDLNCDKTGLRKLLNLIVDKKIKRLIITHKDRLLRMGAELVFSLCAAKKIEVFILNGQEQFDFYEHEPMEDIMDLAAAHSTRLYPTWAKTNQKIIQAMQILREAKL